MAIITGLIVVLILGALAISAFMMIAAAFAAIAAFCVVVAIGVMIGGGITHDRIGICVGALMGAIGGFALLSQLAKNSDNKS